MGIGVQPCCCGRIRYVASSVESTVRLRALSRNAIQHTPYKWEIGNLNVIDAQNHQFGVNGDARTVYYTDKGATDRIVRSSLDDGQNPVVVYTSSAANTIGRIHVSRFAEKVFFYEASTAYTYPKYLKSMNYDGTGVTTLRTFTAFLDDLLSTSIWYTPLNSRLYYFIRKASGLDTDFVLCSLTMGGVETELVTIYTALFDDPFPGLGVIGPEISDDGRVYYVGPPYQLPPDAPGRPTGLTHCALDGTGITLVFEKTGTLPFYAFQLSNRLRKLYYLFWWVSAPGGVARELRLVDFNGGNDTLIGQGSPLGWFRCGKGWKGINESDLDWA